MYSENESNSLQASGAKKQPEESQVNEGRSSDPAELRKVTDQPPPSPPDLKKILIGKVFEPFFPMLTRWTQGLSRKRALLLLILLVFVTSIIGWIWEKPTDAKDFFVLFAYYWDARHRQVPRYSPDQTEITTLLSHYVSDEFAKPRRGSPDGRHDVWTEAQMRISLSAAASIDDADLSKWFQDQMFGRSCWRQHPNSEVDHIGATSWILLAFSRMGQMPNEAQIECLLANQHPTGWWPQYPAQDIEENSSTYATALSVWALYELSKKDLIPQKQRMRVEAAIGAGKDWLNNHNLTNQPATWKDYDRGMYGKESLGISGLVVHVLYVVGSSSSAIDKGWMAALPTDLPTVNDQVASAFPVRLANGGVVSDPTHNFTVPWLLIATVDAYPQGTLTQRAKALRLFDKIYTRRDEIEHKTFGLPWLAAELLMSLRYLQNDRVI